MPNIVQPRGFSPVRQLGASDYNGAVNLYYIPQSDASAYYPGDAVKSAANGDANGVPAVQKAAGTDVVRGVMVGVLVAGYRNTSLSGAQLDLTVQYVPAVKARDYYILVADDPKLIFEIQDDGTSTIPATACNKNAGFTVNAPTAPAQNSATVLANSSVATTATLPLRILGRSQRVGNTAGPNATWRVMFNQHELNGPTAGV